MPWLMLQTFSKLLGFWEHINIIKTTALTTYQTMKPDLNKKQS